MHQSFDSLLANDHIFVRTHTLSAFTVAALDCFLQGSSRRRQCHLLMWVVSEQLIQKVYILTRSFRTISCSSIFNLSHNIDYGLFLVAMLDVPVFFPHFTFPNLTIHFFIYFPRQFGSKTHQRLMDDGGQIAGIHGAV